MKRYFFRVLGGGWFFLATLAVVEAAPVAAAGSTNLSFHTAPNFPKYVSAHLELRDPDGKKWPIYLVGGPAGAGQLNLDSRQPLLRMSWKFEQRAQRLGDQSRRVLPGLLSKTNDPPVMLEWMKLTGLKATPIEGGLQGYEAEVSGKLGLMGRDLDLVGKATFRLTDPKVETRNPGVMAEIIFTLPASQVEALMPGVKGPMEGRASFTAYREIRSPVR